MPWKDVFGQIGAIGVFSLAALFLFLKYFPFKKELPVEAFAPQTGKSIESVQELFESEILGLRREIEIKYQEHERRITKHQAELREEIDVLSARISRLSEKLSSMRSSTPNQ